MATSATAGQGNFLSMGKFSSLNIYILNSRVPILGKLVKKLISPFNIHDILMGNICIVLFPPISNKFDKRRFCLDVSKILFACFFWKIFSIVKIPVGEVFRLLAGLLHSQLLNNSSINIFVFKVTRMIISNCFRMYTWLSRK